LIAALLGALGWLLVWNFVGAVVGFTHGAAAWGAGSSRMEALAGQPAPADLGALDVFTAWLIAFWVGALKLLGVGFLYSYFWTASTAVYFLLRHDADATEMDEVCPEEEEQPPQAVPPARTGEPKAPASEGSLPTDQAE
jgi:hypothetical protein